MTAKRTAESYAQALDWRRAREMVAGAEGLGLTARAELALGYLTRWLPAGAVAVRLENGGRVYLRRRTFNSDFEALRGLFLPRRSAYRIDYAGAAVLDIGGHKGYFGAYALLHGAQLVVSYEPEAVNFACLERAARSFAERGADWQTRNAAVAARSGRAVLHVSGESWTHSLGPLPRSGPAREVGHAQVDVVGLAQALRHFKGHDRVVVKIDAEGSECEIVRALTSDLASRIDVILVEAHEFADCTADDISEPLTALGFSREATVDPAVSRFQSHRD